MLKKRLIVVGDHLMIRPEIQGKTRSGLYLPPSVAETEAVHGGWVVQVGPGLAVASPLDLDEEPWKRKETRSPRYIPPSVRSMTFSNSTRARSSSSSAATII